MNKLCFAYYTSPEGRRRLAVFSSIAAALELKEHLPVAMIEIMPVQCAITEKEFFELGLAIDRYRRGDEGTNTVSRLWKLHNYKQGKVEAK